VQDYLEYRAKSAPSLPALTTLYRLFGSWPDALEAAEVGSNQGRELSRTPDDELVAALKSAAKSLDVSVLSSHAYDDWRNQQPDPKPPSSSVIRKWLGPWANAVSVAGLETTDRLTPRKPTMIEIIEALRQAKSEVTGMLTQQAYSKYVAGLAPDDQEHYPEVIHILSTFPNWDAALRAADVEQADTLHPSGLWTAEEARRIAQSAERILGGSLTEQGYNRIIDQSRKPMPSWEVLNELLKA